MLEDVGIHLVSTGGGLTRATFDLLKSAVENLVSNRTFGYLDNAMSETDTNGLLDWDESLVKTLEVIVRI